MARVNQDYLVATMVYGAAAVITASFIWIVGDILWHGLSELSWGFLLEAPGDAGRSGGINSILVSTLLIVTLCLLIAVPISLGTAILLAEFSNPRHAFGRLVRRSLDVLSGVPSIVFGLFGSAVFCDLLGLGFSILAGALTLSCMVLPILIRTTEQSLRDVPLEYRQSAAALGISPYSTLWHVTLPAAAPGLLAGLVLGIGRALAETAALIFTSGSVDRMPGSLMDSGRALSIHIYDLSMNVPGGNRRAYASALVLILLLLLINGSAGWLLRRWSTSRIDP